MSIGPNILLQWVSIGPNTLLQWVSIGPNILLQWASNINGLIQIYAQ